MKNYYIFYRANGDPACYINFDLVRSIILDKAGNLQINEQKLWSPSGSDLTRLRQDFSDCIKLLAEYQQSKLN